MKKQEFTRKALLATTAVALFGIGIISSAPKANAQNSTPALVITHAPLPNHLREKIYNSPRQATNIRPQDITGNLNGPKATLVTSEINKLVYLTTSI